jgi:hypothetical protein
LIKKEDLVKNLDGLIFEVYDLLTSGLVNEETIGVITYYTHFKLEEITAIYKPNSKGDYIKVWEKKND